MLILGQAPAIRFMMRNVATGGRLTGHNSNQIGGFGVDSVKGWSYMDAMCCRPSCTDSPKLSITTFDFP